MSKSKRSKATDFTRETRQQIITRDSGKCLFCQMDYHMEKATRLDLGVRDIMHYIPRSAGGLGIPQNAAVGCRYHHSMYDNGNAGLHDEMRDIFREYLRAHYPVWDEKNLIYDKWSFLKGD